MDGHDGQVFWVIAQDPLLAQPDTIAAFKSQAFRLDRIGYPALRMRSRLGKGT